MKRLIIYLILCVISLAQAKADFNFKLSLENPLFEKNKGPVVGIDDKHSNLHTANDGLFAFTNILKEDGFQISMPSEISKTELSKIDIYVIINPLNQKNIGNWKRPIYNAFTDDEIELIYHWVMNGGQLFVIADHMPYAGAIKTLAQSFDIEYVDGFVMNEKQSWPPELYQTDLILRNELTRNINQIASFTGSALRSDSEINYIAKFPNTHKIKIPEIAWQFDENTEILGHEDYYLAAYKHFGKGKVFFGTEAAMFTAQIINDRFKVGINSDHAKDNIPLLRNIFKWLSTKDNEHSLVKQLLKAQGLAFTQNKMNEVSEFYTKDAIIYEPTGREIIGLAAIKKYWNSLSGNAVSWSSKINEVEKLGNQILAICEFEIKFKRGNDIATARSKAVLTFKIENGQYRIFRDFYMPLARKN
jgi:ketosteroid isomerase-like protein